MLLESVRGRGVFLSAGVVYDPGMRDPWVYGMLPFDGEFDGKLSYVFKSIANSYTPTEVMFPQMTGAATRFHVRVQGGTAYLGIRLRTQDSLPAGISWLANGYYPPSKDHERVIGLFDTAGIRMIPADTREWYEQVGDTVLITGDHVHVTRAAQAVHVRNVFTQTEQCSDPTHRLYLSDAFTLQHDRISPLTPTSPVLSFRGTIGVRDMEPDAYLYRYTLTNVTGVRVSVEANPSYRSPKNMRRMLLSTLFANDSQTIPVQTFEVREP